MYPWEFWAIPKHIAELRDLKPLDKLVLGIFITRWNGENDDIPAKQNTLALQTGSNDRQIRRSIKNLVKLGYLDISLKNPGKKLSNRYKLK